MQGATLWFLFALVVGTCGPAIADDDVSVIDADATIPYSFFRSFNPQHLHGHPVSIFADNRDVANRGTLYFIEPYLLPDTASMNEGIEEACVREFEISGGGPVSVRVSFELASQAVSREIAASDGLLRGPNNKTHSPITPQRIVAFPYSEIAIYAGGEASGTARRLIAHWPQRQEGARVASLKTLQVLPGRMTGTCGELREIAETTDFSGEVVLKTTSTEASLIGIDLREFTQSRAYRSLFTTGIETGSVRTVSSSGGGGIGLNLGVVKIGYGKSKTKHELVDDRHRAITGNLVDRAVNEYVATLSTTCDASSSAWCDAQIAGPYIRGFLTAKLPELGYITMNEDGSADVLIGELRGALSPTDVKEIIDAKHKSELATLSEREGSVGDTMSAKMKDTLNYTDEGGIGWQRDEAGKWIPKSVSLYLLNDEELSNTVATRYDQVVRGAARAARLDLAPVRVNAVDQSEREQIIADVERRWALQQLPPEKRPVGLGTLQDLASAEALAFFRHLNPSSTVCIRYVEGDPDSVEAWYGFGQLPNLLCRDDFVPPPKTPGCRVSKAWLNWYAATRWRAGLGLLHQDICVVQRVPFTQENPPPELQGVASARERSGNP